MNLLCNVMQRLATVLTVAAVFVPVAFCQSLKPIPIPSGGSGVTGAIVSWDGKTIAANTTVAGMTVPYKFPLNGSPTYLPLPPNVATATVTFVDDGATAFAGVGTYKDPTSGATSSVPIYWEPDGTVATGPANTTPLYLRTDGSALVVSGPMMWYQDSYPVALPTSFFSYTQCTFSDEYLLGASTHDYTIQNEDLDTGVSHILQNAWGGGAYQANDLISDSGYAFGWFQARPGAPWFGAGLGRFDPNGTSTLIGSLDPDHAWLNFLRRDGQAVAGIYHQSGDNDYAVPFIGFIWNANYGITAFHQIPGHSFQAPLVGSGLIDCSNGFLTVFVGAYTNNAGQGIFFKDGESLTLPSYFAALGLGSNVQKSLGKLYQISGSNTIALLSYTDPSGNLVQGYATFPNGMPEIFFEGLGFDPNDPTDTGPGVANAVSSDGNFVVGRSFDGVEQQGVVWSPQTHAMVNLGYFGGNPAWSVAWTISPDAGVIGGACTTDSKPNGTAVLWKRFVGPQDIGGIAPYSSKGSVVRGLNFTGSVAVGYSGTPPASVSGASPVCVAGRYTPGGGWTQLQTPAGYVDTVAYNLSSSGVVAVGAAYSSTGSNAVIWNGTSAKLLPTASGYTNSQAFAVNRSGSLMGGYCYKGATVEDACLWYSSLGYAPKIIGHLPGDTRSYVRAMSGDGTLVTGISVSPSSTLTPFVWTSTGGMESLRDYLSSVGVNTYASWKLQSVSGISDDGTTIVGYGVDPNGKTEPFRAVIPGRSPVSAPKAYTMRANSPYTVSAPGVLLGDLNSSAAKAYITSPPLHGSVSLNTDGSFTYTPNSSFTGADSFHYYSVGPGSTTSEPAMVSLTWTPGDTIVLERINGASPSTTALVGGQTATLTVGIDHPAPPGGVLIHALSNNTAAVKSLIGTIPAGATSVDIPMPTSAVAQDTVVTLTLTSPTCRRVIRFTITPPKFTSFAVNEVSVQGGESRTGTITISSIAPSGGFPVAVSYPTHLSGPTTVTVPAGAASTTFTFTAANVTTLYVETLSASQGGVTSSATMYIDPYPPLSSFTATSSVTGGSNATGTLTLSGNAPSGGAQVTVVSSNPALAAASTSPVHIPQGTPTVNFTITTSAVTTATTVILTAHCGGVSISQKITVNP